MLLGLTSVKSFNSEDDKQIEKNQRRREGFKRFKITFGYRLLDNRIRR